MPPICTGHTLGKIPVVRSLRNDNKISDNKIRIISKFLLSWNFPGKTAFLDNFPQIFPLPNPLQNAKNIINIVVSASLSGWGFSKVPEHLRDGPGFTAPLPKDMVPLTACGIPLLPLPHTRLKSPTLTRKVRNGRGGHFKCRLFMHKIARISKQLSNSHCFFFWFGSSLECLAVAEDYCKKDPCTFNMEMLVSKVGNPCPTLVNFLPAWKEKNSMKSPKQDFVHRVAQKLVNSWSFIANSTSGMSHGKLVFLALVL